MGDQKNMSSKIKIGLISIYLFGYSYKKSQKLNLGLIKLVNYLIR